MRKYSDNKKCSFVFTLTQLTADKVDTNDAIKCHLSWKKRLYDQNHKLLNCIRKRLFLSLGYSIVIVKQLTCQKKAAGCFSLQQNIFRII